VLPWAAKGVAVEAGHEGEEVMALKIAIAALFIAVLIRHEVMIQQERQNMQQAIEIMGMTSTVIASHTESLASHTKMFGIIADWKKRENEAASR
jgi:hypothetical protein